MLLLLLLLLLLYFFFSLLSLFLFYALNAVSLLLFDACVRYFTITSAFVFITSYTGFLVIIYVYYFFNSVSHSRSLFLLLGRLFFSYSLSSFSEHSETEKYEENLSFS